MRRLVFAFAVLAFTSSTALAQALRATARFMAGDVAASDTAAILAGLREGLQADSVLRLVRRPATAAEAVGKTFETAPVMITVSIVGNDLKRGFGFRAVDVRTGASLGATFTAIPAGESLATAAAGAARAYVKSVTWPVK